MKNNKQHYTPPLCEVITLDATIGMMAMSGEGLDTNEEYEFGWANERRGTWGNLWADE